MKKSGDEVFRGEAQYSIDSKGRIIVPAKYREQLGEHFIITKGLDNCLFVYPLKEWEEFEKKVNALPITDPKVRRFNRTFIGGAADAETDSQFRVMVPANLREYAGITKEVVLVGQISRIEMWSLEAWQRYNEADDAMDDDVAAKMAEFGI